MCGENKHTTLCRSSRRGSSPRVRGKRHSRVKQLASLGLIPACAGKTQARKRACAISRAHPRVCGENLLLRESDRAKRGSSPRVRGKRCPCGEAGPACGLIPACAGKTSRTSSCFCSSAAHPRVCGENGLGAPEFTHEFGSSPRVRGKQHLRIRDQLSNGLIPACAGKTMYSIGRPVEIRAHPRVCGENRKSSR